jgi:hypothetical protein
MDSSTMVLSQNDQKAYFDHLIWNSGKEFFGGADLASKALDAGRPAGLASQPPCLADQYEARQAA